jgi:hypothetical protein
MEEQKGIPGQFPYLQRVEPPQASYSFDVNTAQYTSYFKIQHHLTTFPIQATFNDTHYKKKKPLPSEGEKERGMTYTELCAST